MGADGNTKQIVCSRAAELLKVDDKSPAVNTNIFKEEDSTIPIAKAVELVNQCSHLSSHEEDLATLKQVGSSTPILISKIGTDPNYKLTIVWFNFLGFIALHIIGLTGALAAILGFCSFWTTAYSLWLIYVAGQGVTMGAHRHWSHRAFKAKRWLKIVLLYMHTLAGQNCLWVWVRDHRQHHKYSDTDADPHNANRGFWFSHLGWLCVRKHPKVLEYGKKIDMSDLDADPYIMFQKNHYKVLYTIFALGLPTMLPCYLWGENVWMAIWVAYFARTIINLNVTWLVNSAAHLYGTRPYDDTIFPVESLFVSILATGEGWHNYHHAFPWDYRAAELGTPYNLTCKFIDFFAKYGVVYDRREATATMSAQITFFGPLDPELPGSAVKGEMEVLKKKIAKDFKKVSEIREYVESEDGQQASITRLSPRLKGLEEANKRIQENYENLLSVFGESEADKHSEERWSAKIAAHDEDYYELEADINDLINAQSLLTTAVQSTNSSSRDESKFHHQVRLPLLDLPKFDGNLSNWSSFKATFEAVIHKSEHYSNILKFRYLSSCLTIPSMSNPINNFVESEETYEPAWKALVDRYDDKRKLLQHHWEILTGIEAMTNNSASELRRVLDMFTSQLTSLRKIGYQMDLCDNFSNFLVVNMVLTCLHKEVELEWKKHVKREEPKWGDLKVFLEDHWSSIDDARPLLDTKSAKAVKVLLASGSESVVWQPPMCVVCQIRHYLWECATFKDMTVPQRKDVCRSYKLCLRCYSTKHQIRTCTSKYACTVSGCTGRHHTLLHDGSSSRPVSPMSGSMSSAPHLRPSTPPFQPTPMTRTTHMAHGSPMSTTAALAFLSSKHNFLVTAQVKVADNNGDYHVCRALLDSGSDTNFISHKLAKRLRLRREDTLLGVKGFGTGVTYIHKKAQVSLRARSGMYEKTLECAVSSHFCGNIPSSTLIIESVGNLAGYSLADPNFYVAGRNDLLLNATVFMKSLKDGKVDLSNGLTLVNTEFGWVVVGEIETQLKPSSNLLHGFSYFTRSTDEGIEENLKKRLNCEEIESDVPSLTPEERCDEELFKSSTFHTDDGKFLVETPLKLEVNELGSNVSNGTRLYFAQEASREKNVVLNESHVDYNEAELPVTAAILCNSFVVDEVMFDVVVDEQSDEFGFLRKSLREGSISRGLLPHEIKDCVLWWNCPSFFTLPKSQWPGPIVVVNEHEPEVMVEMKKTLAVQQSAPKLFHTIETTFSCAQRLIRCFGYLWRYIHNLRFRDSRRRGPLTMEEREQAETLIIKIIQKNMFPNEFAVGSFVLLKDTNLPPLKWSKGRIVALHPGKEKVVRNVTVLTENGPEERHIRYLCVHPMEDTAKGVGECVPTGTAIEFSYQSHRRSCVRNGYALSVRVSILHTF